ncbi:DUF2207 domain-containing protein [Pelagibacterium luteolum]|uniref:Predicted membrane protein n=1 Tax=Pelagibacterium luteolum TaxID=440168 RepID=A0A1G7TX81_9HYPH|nr:DUF2207 domain-containing protein [Pelagibacterium luteolum]SDG39624.1 Predicted membrane protein [Pelagibacterium luteolum]
MTLFRLFVFLGGLLFALAPALGQEQIRAFDVQFDVQRDGSVRVTETITVNAEGDEIRRGIFRDIPTTLETDGGGTVRMPISVEMVTRNGSAEPFDVEGFSGGRRIRIGSPDALLSRGEHTYEIVYIMERAVRSSEDFDELYWNATGNYWSFPILRSRAFVTLPEEAQIIEVNGYTGAVGEQGSDSSAERISDNQARFVVTRTLQAGEGLTISVTFAKGVIVSPEGSDAVAYWLSDYRDFVVPIVMLIIVIAFNGLAWGAVGRDPAKGTIIPRFYPPKGYSPALTHYIHRMGWQNSGWLAYSAALVSLAVKGLVEIEKAGKTTIITVTDKAPDAPLPPGEAVALSDLAPLSPVTIDKTSGPKLAQSRTNVMQALEKENRAVYFKNNVAFVVLGILLGLGCLVGMVVLGVLDPLFVFIAAFAAVFLSVLGLAARSMWQGTGIGRFIALGIIGIFALNFSSMAIDLFRWTPIDFPFVAAVSIIAITLVFAILMRAPTVHGRKLMDEIDGFKMYIETAEKERLNMSGEPEMTTQRFEAVLPYAMALGVEKPWSERFQNDLARNAVKDAGAGYSPRWYHGGNFSSGNFARTMTGVTSGIGAAMISAQPVSSSSSGSGGGGFSGGGGGGGGGGGW